MIPSVFELYAKVDARVDEIEAKVTKTDELIRTLPDRVGIRLNKLESRIELLEAKNDRLAARIELLRAKLRNRAKLERKGGAA